MSTFFLRFSNSKDDPIFIQVDPWAGLYVLNKGDQIEFSADCSAETPSFEVDEYNTTRIVTLVDCSEYYVVKDGKRIHWTEYPTNCNKSDYV